MLLFCIVQAHIWPKEYHTDNDLYPENEDLGDLGPLDSQGPGLGHRAILLCYGRTYQGGCTYLNTSMRLQEVFAGYTGGYLKLCCSGAQSHPHFSSVA